MKDEPTIKGWGGGRGVDGRGKECPKQYACLKMAVCIELQQEGGYKHE